jgi:two-component system, cell cycle response regulator
MVAHRKQRPTLVETTTAVDQDHTTEQIEAVFPEYGNTVTVTELGAIDAPLVSGEHRATLVLVAGPAPGQVYTLPASRHVIIGRDPMADIIVEDSAVSRQHARIGLENGVYIVEDLGSSNGTFVAGTKVRRYEVENGERIQLGPRIVLRFALLDDAEERMLRQLFESSTRDPLTNAFNKKYITERLTAEVAHSVRHSSSLELCVFDLDHFKQVNDQYGHLVGDTVLRQVADRVHSLIRSEDVFGRFGGEEFIVVSRSSNVARLAERIRAAIEQMAIPTDRGLLRVTVSLGVARLDEIGAPATVDGLIARADERLYEAKRLGRNQVRATDPRDPDR